MPFSNHQRRGDKTGWAGEQPAKQRVCLCSRLTRKCHATSC
jgi:hypothetical protein